MSTKNYLSNFAIKSKDTDKTYYLLGGKKSKVHLSSMDIISLINNLKYV